MTDQLPGRPVLSVRNVSLSYWLKGKHLLKHRIFYALRDISFDVYCGESLGVIGRNGAGKSTILSLLAGVMSPDSGTIERQEGVTTSLLSLNLGLLGHLTGRENALQGALFQGVNLRQFRSRLEEVKEFSGLGEFFEEPIYTYSAGMKARLCFSIAFQVDPTVLLVDELLGVGDQQFKEKVVAVMKERLKSQDQTVVFVSHSMEIVREICTRVLWIEDGMLVREGDAGEVVPEFLARQRQEQTARRTT